MNHSEISLERAAVRLVGVVLTVGKTCNTVVITLLYSSESNSSWLLTANLPRNIYLMSDSAMTTEANVAMTANFIGFAGNLLAN